MSLRPETRIVFPQLLMRRPNLEELPRVPMLPVGYVLRLIEPNEDKPLAELLSLAFPEFIWNTAEVRKRLTKTVDVHATYVIDWKGIPIATASVRLTPDKFPGSGYLHWVAVHPDHRGRHFGQTVTLQVLHHFRNCGCNDSVLETEDYRIPAIKTYLNLGYTPEASDPSHPDRWAAVRVILARGDS